MLLQILRCIAFELRFGKVLSGVFILFSAWIISFMKGKLLFFFHWFDDWFFKHVHILSRSLEFVNVLLRFKPTRSIRWFESLIRVPLVSRELMQVAWLWLFKHLWKIWYLILSIRFRGNIAHFRFSFKRLRSWGCWENFNPHSIFLRS